MWSTMNGETGATQNFAVGTSGNSPAFSSATNTHTLNIPMANAGGSVTAGLISNADHAAFTGKLGDVVDDTTPQLGGNLDVNGNDIPSAAGLDIAIGSSVCAA